MKTCVLVILFISTFTALQSQTDSNQSVIMYFSIFPSEREDFFDMDLLGYPEVSFSQAVSFGYQWNHSKRFIHEIEIMPLRYYHIDYQKAVFDSSGMDYYFMGNDNQFYNSSARYSYSYLIGFKKINLIIGGAGRLFYCNQRIRPYTSREFFRSVTSAGMMLEVIPALQFELTRNISIRFDVPFSLADIDFRRVKNENPQLERRQQISDQIGLYLLDHNFQFRLGMSCKIRDSLK